MKLEQSFEVTAPLDRVWSALIDVERVAPCLPGAEVTGRNEDGSYDGTFKVKIGPTAAAYSGKLHMDDVDETTHTATMHAQGTDRRGQGGAKATIVSSVSEAADGATLVNVVTDYNITGRLARFGRGGMIEEISNRLLHEFAKSLQQMLSADGAAVAAAAPAETAPAPAPAPVGEAPAPEPAAPPAAEEPAPEPAAPPAADEPAPEPAAPPAAEEPAPEPAAPPAADGAPAPEPAPAADEPEPEPAADEPASAADEPVAPTDQPAPVAPDEPEPALSEAAASATRPTTDEVAQADLAAVVPEADPAASPPPPPPPPRIPAPESEPIQGLSLMGSVVWGQVKRNPAPVVALVLGFLIALRVLRRRG